MVRNSSGIFIISLLIALTTIAMNNYAFAASSNNSYAIKGKAVTINGIKDGWLLVKNGVIEKVGAQEKEVPDYAKRIEWNQYIFPGLIDTHNHPIWNSVPQWTHGPFVNRYKWKESPIYLKQVNQKYDDFGDLLKSTSLKYAEARALIGGTTMLQGSYYKNQPDSLCRNLDPRYKVASRVGNIAKDDKREAEQLEGLKNGSFKRLFIHLAEGLAEDPVSNGEFAILSKKGFAREGVVIIHGLGLDSRHFEEMAKKKIHLVWSPVSNWNLYRGIADIKSALKAGLIISLAPDWTVSGSDNVLEEMKFAYAVGNAKWGDIITPKLLFEMVTTNAAKISGLDKDSIEIGKPMGQLANGYAADFFLAPILDAKSEPNSKDNPYESLLRTYPKHIQLVFIDGKPVYGGSKIMNKLVESLDFFKVQNTPKAITKINSKEIYRKLQTSLGEVAPLVEN